MDWRIGASQAGDLAEACRTIFYHTSKRAVLAVTSGHILSPKMVMGIPMKSAFQVSPGTSDVVSDTGVCF